MCIAHAPSASRSRIQSSNGACILENLIPRRGVAIMRACKTCCFAVCVDCFFAMQHQPSPGGYFNEKRRIGGEARESNMRLPVRINARVTARVAIIELRSLLVADAPISRRRRDDLIDKATTLARSSQTQAWAAQRLCALIEQRFARNPDTFQPSKATHVALQILWMLQEGSL